MATGGVSDLDRGTDETFDFLCSMCQGQNKNTEGEHFCADCSDYYCSTHVKIHKEVPALKNHKILNKAQFQQPSPSVQFPAVPTERCRVHGHKPVDMFCRQHDLVGCATCMVVKHSGCKEKFYVPDYIKNITIAANPNNITVQMDAIDTSVAELQKVLIKEKAELKRSKENSLKQIQKWRIEVNKLLDILEKKTVNELEQRSQTLTEKIETALRELQASTTDIQSAQNSLKSSGSNMAQMFVSIKIANEVASLTKEIVNTTKRQVSSTEISFMPHPKLQLLLKEMQALGDISLTETRKPTAPDSLQQVTKTQTSSTSSKNPSTTASLLPVTMTQTSHKSSNDQSTTTSLLQVTVTKTRQQSYEGRPKPSILQVKGKKTYTVKMKSDINTCCIVSACTLADGTIILADNYNSKLKRVNSTSFTVTDCCEIPNDPWQACSITDQEVAVTCPSSCLLQFVSIGRTMQKTREINTGFSCYALAYADGKLFVSDACTSVYVCSVSGARQQQFSLDQYGQQIFSHIRSLAVSSDHSKIYVSDWDKGLMNLNRTGKLVGQFDGPELEGANSVYLYKNDSVLVCGGYSNNVLQFSPDGKLQGEVLKTDAECRTVCCNKDNTKLIVGLHQDAEIEVYDIN